jgi:hypothetical protein
MNGYLQRLAASVMEPARGLHPTVGSRWEAAHSRGVEQESEAMVHTTPRMSVVGVNPGTTVRPSNLEQPMVETLRPAGRPVDEVARVEMEARAEDVEAQRVRTEASPAFSRGAARVAEAARVSSSAKRGEEEAAAPARAFVPLLPEVRGAGMQARPLMPLAAVQPVRTQPTTQAVREPDAIEIHIGRIEVTAAQSQSPVRPAARKSLDLGEYLKRDRRSR